MLKIILFTLSTSFCALVATAAEDAKDIYPGMEPGLQTPPIMRDTREGESPEGME